MHNRKTPSSLGGCRAPTSDLIHHVLSPRQAELLAALGRIVGKQRDGDGEEERERGKKVFIWE